MSMKIRDDNKAELYYSLTTNDVDSHSTTRLSTYENLVQEAAGMHTAMRKCGILDLQKNNRTWVIARSRMEIYAYPRWPNEITVTTWSQDSTGFNCPRHTDATDQNGVKLFDCQTRWAVIDFKTGRPVRGSEINALIITPSKEEQGDIHLPPLMDEDQMCQTVLFTYEPQIRYLDTDLNRHVNNLSYFNWSLDALPISFRDEYKPCLVDARWEKQCYSNDSLAVVIRAASKDELTKEEPVIWADIFRKDEKGNAVRAFNALIVWKKREKICI